MSWIDPNNQLDREAPVFKAVRQDELIDLQKDRKRLDWLSSYASSHRYPWGIAWGFPAPSHSQDLREAIDKTMETIK